MKKFLGWIALSVTGVLIGVVGVLASNNPDRAAYETYATRRLSEYLQENVCTSPSLSLLDKDLPARCLAIVQANQHEIRRLVSVSTTRRNFIVLSIYDTNLSVKSIVPLLPQGILPSFEFETVGVLQMFYTYKAEQR